MGNVAIVAHEVAVLFVLMGAGFMARRLRVLGDAAVDGLANLLMVVVTPCLIVDCFRRPFDPQMLGALGVAFAIAVVGHFAAIAIAAFVESLDGGAPYPIDGREARKSVDLIERIYRDAGRA